jgi:hypothetical protein
MGAPAKKRAQAEKVSAGSPSQPSSDGSTPKSIPRLDGNRDPGILAGRAPVDYSRPNDLKNISDFLGLAGWYAARGVSPFFSCEFIHACSDFLESNTAPSPLQTDLHLAACYCLLLSFRHSVCLPSST